MLARRISPKIAVMWEAVINDDSPDVRRLKAAAFSELLPPDKALSVYECGGIDDVTDVALALSLVEGVGAKLAKFLIFPKSAVQAKQIGIQSTPGDTLCEYVDSRHRDIIISNVAEAFDLADIMIRGQMVTVGLSAVEDRHVWALDQAKYDLAQISKQRQGKTKANAEAIILSTATLIQKGRAHVQCSG